jgi:cbb3-type cytochrome oxidase subunit 3
MEEPLQVPEKGGFAPIAAAGARMGAKMGSRMGGILRPKGNPGIQGSSGQDASMPFVPGPVPSDMGVPGQPKMRLKDKVKGFFTRKKSTQPNAAQGVVPPYGMPSSDPPRNNVTNMPPGLNEAFLVVHKLTVMMAGLIFLLMVFYGIIDIFAYLKNEIAQRVERSRDPNLFNKDTTDMKALSYLTNNDIDDEIYHIYQQQRLISYLFVVAGITVIMFGIQLGLYFSLKIFAVITQRDFQDKVDVPTKLLGAMVIMVAAAFAIKGIYKKHFIRKVQTGLRDMRSKIRDIRTFIYNNMTTNSLFLAALRSDNIEDIIDTIAAILQSRSSSSCTDKLNPCDADIENMIFTLNLYSYLKVQVPDSDPNFDKIRRMFEVDGIQNREVDPAMYFYYKQPTYITNLYPVMRTRMQKYFGTPTGKDDDFTPNPTRESIFTVNLANKMQDLNARLSALYNMATGKNKVVGYLFLYLFNVLFFGLILAFVFWPETKNILQTIKDFIKSRKAEI